MNSSSATNRSIPTNRSSPMNSTFTFNRTGQSTGRLIGSIMEKSQDAIIIASSILAAALFFHTLYVYFRGGASLRVRTLSRCMISYMVFNAISIALATPKYTYALFDESIPEWTWLLSNVNLVLEPLTVFFLALERCVTILFMWNTKKKETIVFVCNIICNIACILSIVLPKCLQYLWKWLFKERLAFSGFDIFYIFILKMTVGVLNAFLCAFLCWKVRAIQKRTSQKSTTSRIVIISCVTELLLEFFPNLTAVIITMMGYNYIFSKYTGPYSKTTQCINVLICAIIYSRTFRSKRNTYTKTKALDRCLTIQFMTKTKRENVVFICNIICITTCTLSIVLPTSVVYVVELPASTINAISFYKSMYIFSLKMTVGVLNACACAFLCWKVRTFQKKNINNTIVIVSCVTELLLEFFPNLTASVIVMTGNSYIFSYSGPYATTTQCINVMICAIIYRRTLHVKRIGNGNITVVGSSIKVTEVRVDHKKGPPRLSLRRYLLMPYSMNRTAHGTNSSESQIGTIVSNSQNVIIIVSSILAIVLFSHTLYLYIIREGAGLRVKTLSKCMISYMAFNTVTSAAAIPHYTFSLFKMSTPVWAGTLSDVHLALEPLTVFFLALDRCLTVQFMWKAKTERVLFVCNIICNTACILSIVLPAVMTNLFILPLPNAIYPTYIFSLKMVAGVLNACACAFLCWKVRAIKKRNISNTIVIVSCVTELLLEFFPNLTAALISIVSILFQ
ncbi:hypothetical protein DdX_21609 [Ditylenchus destructor]|uniref:Uncharacterized protein n=1 Tax=Ditylenchus destructor TaxID=166010 RepID=A0AAD4MH19_9BILA|nr:hypothetical protein DdX_21609 [Ditylenchus destructor]